jgi:peptidoglycan/LPS O-acetylase OafA/YrhL
MGAEVAERSVESPSPAAGDPAVGRFGYRPALNGIRGIAIAIVVGFHAFRWPPNGTLGVDLFFVLSGFLITTLLLEEHQRTGTISLRQFYVRRARRLLPALFVMLAAYLFVFGVSGGTNAILAVAASLFYASNILAAVSPSSVPGPLQHLWSLAQEEQFYVLWPPLLLLLLRARRHVLGVLVALVATACAYRLLLAASDASFNRIFWAPDTHLEPLAIGCLFGAAFHARRIPPWLSSTTATVVAVASALPMVLVARVGALVYLTPLLTVFSLAAGVVLVAAIREGSVTERVLSLPPLVALGVLSYSLYLWHMPILFTTRLVSAATPAVVLGLALSVAASFASYRLVESRFRRARAETPAVPAVQPA